MEIVKCPKCGSEDIYYSKENDAECCCMKCLTPFLYIEKPLSDEKIAELKKAIDNAETHIEPYPQAHGCENIPDDVPNFGARWYKPKETFRPVPCVRDEHGEIKEQSVKQLIGKVNEELDELKESIVILESKKRFAAFEIVMEQKKCVAEEAADTVTALTTLCEALGINAGMRVDAQRCVNEKNRERGRL